MIRNKMPLIFCIAALGAMLPLCAFDLSQRFTPQAERARESLQQLPSAVSLALESFLVPGAAIGVVVDGQVVFAQGFGYRDLEGKKSVTEETLFPIGSCTKAFTTFAMGCMVDEGLLDWDQPVIDIMPEFRLSDPYATQNLTLRDLAANRSGMARHDLVWYNSSFTRKELLYKLRYLSPMCAIRERFCYNNLLFLAAGMAMEKIAKTSWEEIVQSRILHPLQMAHTHFSIQAMQASNDHAVPYLNKQGCLKRMAFRDISVIGPAGSMISNLSDLCRWVQLHTREGEWGGASLIRKATLSEIYSPQIVAGGCLDSKEAQVGTYGLGWHVQTYRGRYHVSHDGGIDGFTSHIALMPGKSLESSHCAIAT